MTESEPAELIRSYYTALRQGDPLGPYFAETTASRKFGISEQLTGYPAIREGLREQTAHTTDWQIQSNDLAVVDQGCHAWFSDFVDMAWTNTESSEQYEFATRWSGMLENNSEWQFVGMHVSVPHGL